MMGPLGARLTMANSTHTALGKTHHTVNPWHLATLIPEHKCKMVLDNWHSYHSLPLASEEDKALTTFITPWGRHRYRMAPQGL